METTETLNLREVKDAVFAAIDLVTAQIQAESISDSNAHWLPCPFRVAMAGLIAEKGLAAAFEVRITAEVEPYALTYMLAKPLPYLLYAACIDTLRRQPHDGGAREYEVGELVREEVVVGGVRAEGIVSIIRA